MAFVIRRVHVAKLEVGPIALSQAEAHHVRDVLRVAEGDLLELFDAAGNAATGPIVHLNPGNVVVQVDSIRIAVDAAMRLTVAAAVPKGDRADWMVEKLTELGVVRFIPLIAERSVVIPAGKNKVERWERIAVESAKQSRRNGIMTIAPPTNLKDVLSASTSGWFLSTGPTAIPVGDTIKSGELLLLIGPEGGWTSDEIQAMRTAKFAEVGLTATVLRIETAAIVAAGVALSLSQIKTAIHSPSSSD